MTPELPNGPISLFLDVDGTLIDIAPRPDAVVVAPHLIETLNILDRRLDGALALVSGRTIADLDHLFHPLRLRASGVHGAEMRFDANHETESVAGDAVSEDIVARLRDIAGSHVGTLVENKRYSVAIHYRAAPAAREELARELQLLIQSEAGQDLRILPGHMVFELKRATFDKGVAIGNFLTRAPFQGRRPIFCGDDVTDTPGFDAVLAAGGLAFSVGFSRPGLSGSFADPAAVRDWLAHMAQMEASGG
ncbi:trehalose-phosphatase [Lichenifustis flavocetrariae]|uniref:Trehalose 6-phosphate phosphatase n=1 Tax=Lichenifustis flavocetrariae TaxID=2949735 RepID=A0AA42CMC4_9HYPH|nr:trehalose-phosphatase [Lichenifustis flavocetrariae]MCW6508210.1 trehalose-phosphatase [Lichenifustis flavocetrariae]